MEKPRYYIKVCEVCGRQVNPHVDHNLGASRWVRCGHGFKGLGTMEQVGWKKVEVVLVDEEFEPPIQCPAVSPEEERPCRLREGHTGAHEAVRGPFQLSSWG